MAETWFDGESYDGTLDQDRLTTQLGYVRALLWDGRPHTLQEGVTYCLTHGVTATTASVSARVRDLRKPRFGGYTVRRERVAGARGLFTYQLLRPAPVAVAVARWLPFDARTTET